ncbi:MAG: type II toxin-antitoxin system VapC family toxin [Phreatobacter sp.]|uniref:type II toxin-antitoxin system VapC family toxin n=1 Tax=Phreatobacter sp. TaxID=1966341 RepID=UPI001A45A4BE|nr:type II toxin-antitoxin system VapC family toxin [Phreatobacter sp.]MBL8568840.1 type II toxin-antitoxin system VapC family toxin [Phreatobacter sp.]
MMVVDTSALMAIALNEPAANACSAALEHSDDCLISAATVAEAMIVAARRNVTDEMEALIGELGIEVVPVSVATARAVAAAYGQWGKGVHPAGLNFGDCFAYALARERGCPLLFVGDDFSRTDIISALVG